MAGYKKKLIEVALPLEAINVASAREKSIRHGHPSTLHLWWSRKPLAACRAVLFASLVDDPEQDGVPQALLDRIDQLPASPKYQPVGAGATLGEHRRSKLFGFIDQLVQWENSNNPDVMRTAHELIMAATDGNPPPVLDPFCGGGSIPLEAQRLGLEAHGSDLNPVAVLITKALIEIPPKFAGQPPVNPGARKHGLHTGTWNGAAGLAEDVRYYGEWMRKEAEKRIGHLYPKAVYYLDRRTGETYTQAEYDEIDRRERTPIGDPSSLLPRPSDLERQELTVIAWKWARTVKCPNPGCGAQMPLVNSFALSTKPGKEAWVEPRVVTDVDGRRRVEFSVRRDRATPPEGTVGRRGARCVACGSPVPLDHVRAEGRAKRMGAQLMAIVADGERGRFYLPPDCGQVRVAESAEPEWAPEQELPRNPRDFKTPNYGMTKWADLFTSRQLVALTTFSDLVGEAAEQARQDAAATGWDAEQAQAYADAVRVYLAFVVDRLAMTGNNLVRWNAVGQKAQHCFGRQALPMLWDYCEPNFLGSSTGSLDAALFCSHDPLNLLGRHMPGDTNQSDAANSIGSLGMLVSTDPPYYDNIGYADLSDFFYVWLRKSLRCTYPSLFSTLLVPKSSELVASPHRQGGAEAAKRFFEDGLRKTFCNLGEHANRAFPTTIYYAFKQAETEADDFTDSSVSVSASTGWETFLSSLINSGFRITGTWPVRTEMQTRQIAMRSNALASSIVLVCRPRPDDAPIASRREFIQTLRRELESALVKMMHGNIAPVDLAQATIGPGMAVYSRYKQVLDADGSPVRVRTALQIINQELDAILSAQEGEYDTDTRFCVAWFEQFGMESGAFGQADVMARAKNTSVQGLADAGVLEARAGKVRLLKREEYAAEWDPAKDARRPIWESAQYLVRALHDHGEGGAARVAKALGGDALIARDLAYRLYSICERKGWAQEALAYNGLVIAWPAIMDIASNPNVARAAGNLFGDGEAA